MLDSMKLGCSLGVSSSGLADPSNTKFSRSSSGEVTTVSACSLFIVFSVFLGECFLENRRLVPENPSQVTDTPE